MKKYLAKTFIFILILCLITGNTVFIHAANPIDPQRPSSLTIQYKYSQKTYSDLSVKIYRIAEVFENGTYSLTGIFKSYPVNIYGITSQAEWKKIAVTLAAYIAADDIPATCEGATDNEGKVMFENLSPGMYLTLSVRSQQDGEIIVFEDFLTVLPYPSEEGEHQYDVSVYPKCESYTPAPEHKEHKVVKQWQDGGYADIRPQKVDVDIYKNGVLQFSQTLSSDNGWVYRWEAMDDGSRWQAVERNVPAEYTVTVAENGETIIITNVYNHGIIEPPPTGETGVIWPYILSLSVSGILIIAFSIWSKRKAT